ncbi:MAG: biotin/lipoyl-binding protein [Anaerolineae bacterium]|nr:biotin/lipoyl-binding protein [Anaerolineae bacterium]
MSYVAVVNDESFRINLDDPELLLVNEEPHEASIEGTGAPSLYSLIVDNSSYEVHVEEREGSYRVLLLGQLYDVHVEEEGAFLLTKAQRPGPPVEDEEVSIKSPIPGLIFDVTVAEGQQVAQGDILVIVEAMKMENELRASRDGTVQAIHVGPGDSVDKGTLLVTLT